MSSRLVGHVLEYYRKDCSLGEFVLALTIADEAAHSGDNVRAAPSEMARLSRQSLRHVQRLLKKMVADDWLQLLERSRGGRGQATTYQINPEWVRHPDCMNKQRQNYDTMSQFEGDKLRHHVIVSEPAPFSLKNYPPLSPQHSGSAGPSATAADRADEDLRLSQWMFALVREINPKQREPNWKRWVREIRLMTADGRSHREIAELFKWANADRVPHPGGDFCWATNIINPKKLWTHWDMLTIRRNADPASTTAPPVDPLCSVCHERPWSMMQGKSGPRTCSQCFDTEQARAA